MSPAKSKTPKNSTDMLLASRTSDGMKILMVSSYLPYPLLNGGSIRLYNLIKHLSKEHDITLVCEKREFQSQKDIDEVAKVCQKVITVPRKKQWTLLNILRTGFSLDPFLVIGHKNEEMENKIKEELENKSYDLIHAETSYIMQNIPQTFLPIVLVEHNVEYLVYQRYAKYANFILRPFLYFDVWKLKRGESNFWKRATKLVAVSSVEKEIMGAHEVVPNGTDIKKFKIREKVKIDGERRVLFIGDFAWIQNRDAIVWIIKDIWQEIKSKIKNSQGVPKEWQKSKVKLWVVSKRIPDSIKKLTSDPDVVFDENAPVETERIYQKADVLLSPIRVGGGSSFKIIEAMASGVPVVTTGLGNGGVGGTDREHLLVSENSKGIVDHVCELLTDDKLRTHIRTNARKFVEENYSWDIIAKKLDSVYDSAKSASLLQNN